MPIIQVVQRYKAATKPIKFLPRRKDHARGGVEFVNSIGRVEDLIDQGEQAIRIEQQRIKAESEKAKLIRRTIWVMAWVLAAGLLGILWILNLRKTPCPPPGARGI